MAKIPLPDRGQPLDVEYIYLLASAINSLSNQISQATSKYTSITSPDSSGTHNIKTGDARVVAGFAIATQQGTGAGTSASFSMSLGEGFKYTPIATATPVNTGASNSTTDVSVVIESVTPQNVSGKVYFGTAGNYSTRVNIIAVGVPV